MFNHIVYVSNRILLLAKQDGVTSDSLETMGKYLWRLFRVAQAYEHKQREATLGGILSIVADFESVFTGG